MNPGIDRISFYTPHYYLDLKTLAEQRGVDPDKYRLGIGQERMAVPPPDEDIVTLAANAAWPLLSEIDLSSIDCLLFATESGVDQSKAAGLFVHGLLKLPARCRVVELKQACYAGTVALRLAATWVQANPEIKALVLASDIARYDLGSPGEPTQGAGAVAMLVTARPRLLALDPEAGYHAEDVMDFWRPNYREEALVDGKYSTRVYLTTMVAAWQQYHERSGRALEDHARLCFHLPFTRMAEKACARLARAAGRPEPTPEEINGWLDESLAYNRLTGNTYTASLYQGLASLLDRSTADLGGSRVGLFSYGSGCMAEFFSGVVVPGYREVLLAERHRSLLEGRTELTYRQYEDIFQYGLPRDGDAHELSLYRTGPFRLAGIREHKRVYESVE